MKNKLNKYNNGGKVGEWFMNQGRSLIDTPLSMIGMNNVIPDEAYKGAGSKFFKGYSNIMGGVGKAALPIAGQMVGIPAPVTMAAQQGLGSLNPQEQMSYADGGIHSGLPTAEVEKEELIRMPNGSTAQVDGPSHENGGVPVNIPNGTQIFSDRLKDPMTKMSFAKLAEKYKVNKEQKVLDDEKANPLAKSTAKLAMELKQRKLSEIFNKQEELKLQKANSYAKKLGLGDEFKYGGTKLPQYGGTPPWITDGIVSTSPQSGVNVDYGDNISNPSYSNNFKSQPPSLVQNINQTNKYSPSGIDYAMMASNLIGPAYNLATNKKPKPFSYVTPDYQKYDPTAELNEADRQNRVAQNLAKNFAAGNSAAYLATMPMLQANMMNNKQNVLNKAQNINTQYYNQLQPTIADIKNKNIDAMQQDIARYRDINRAAVTNLGENVSGTLRGVKQGQQDVSSANLISSMFPDYNYDVKSNKWVHQKTGKILGA